MSAPAPADRFPEINGLRRCTKCTLPETHESIVFDAEGVCNVCRQIEYKRSRIDWDERGRELHRIVDKYRGKGDYDCIIPFSGGKDSTYTLWAAVVKLKLKPLVVSFDHGFYRPGHLANVERTLKKVGADYLRFRPDWQTVRKLLVESLRRKGDFCWHCHTGIFSYPFHIAIKFKVPLMFWGEPSAEYTSYYTYEQMEEMDERHFNRFINLGITAHDMVGFLDGSVTERDLKPFTFPAAQDLRDLKVRSLYLGSYEPWDVKKQVEVIRREIGWEYDVVEGVPPEYPYEKLECAMQGVRDYLKFIKRGYGRTAHLTAIDIRNGRLSREEGARLMKEYDGKRPASLDVFLEYTGLSVSEFYEIALSHCVAPYRHDPSKDVRGPELPDQASWDRTCGSCSGDCTIVPTPKA